MLVEPYELTAHEVCQLLQRKELSARELCDAVLERIEQLDGDIRAYLTVTPDEAREQARRVDERRAAGEELHPLAGVPLAIKDNMCTRGVKTTCASKILANFVPPFDATVVARAREAGLVFLGKTNLDEFAMGSSTENSGFFPTHNPWDKERVPGGSSGGSAAAIAAQEAILALGSDTGGSIRQPASFCGVVGLKPTYGRVSRYGLVAFASSLDQIGPLTKDVRDAALLLNVISGKDPLDATSAEVDVPDFTESLIDDVNGVRIGVVRELFAEGVQDEVRDAVRAAIDVLADAGAQCEEVSLPHALYGLPCYYLIAPSEASSNLARFDGVRYGHRTQERVADHIELYQKTRREGFGAEVKRRILIGTYALSAGYYDAYYLKALKVRTLIKRDFEKAFERFDVLAAPTSPTVAFKLGERLADHLAMKMSDVCTIPVNLAGIPGISVPCGLSREGLPIGLQLMSKLFDEQTLLRVAYTYEQATEWHLRRPEL